MNNERYLDTTLSAVERAKDLLEKMDVDEKFAQLQCCNAINVMIGKSIEEQYPYGVGQVSGLISAMLPDRNAVAKMVKQLQSTIMEQSKHRIPAIFHIETLTGALITDASCFPCGIGQASTWDVELQQQMGEVIGHQTRALGFSQGLAPVLDVCRDPRFGRQGEGYGEDPTLGAAMGTAFVNGVQKDQQVLATGKHFLGFMAGQGGIHGAQTQIPERELREVYAKPFQAAITEGNIGSVMNSYGAINGEPLAGSKKYMREFLRDEMGFDGMTVSDYASIGQLATVHHVAQDYTQAGQLALYAGMDEELQDNDAYQEMLKHKIQSDDELKGLLDEAVLRILTKKFQLGLFEHPFPSEDLSDETYQVERGKTIACKSACESMVLLKNDGILPLTKECTRGKKIAVIGYHGNSTRALFGGYMAMSLKESTVGVHISMAGVSVEEGSPVHQTEATRECYPGSIVQKEHPEIEALVRSCYPGIRSLQEVLKARYPEAEIVYATGYPYAGTDDSGFEEALNIVESSDIVICTLGGHYGWNVSATSGEGIDSMNLGLPACQEAFLEKIKDIQKPIIGIHFDGHPCSSDRADTICHALIEAWAPGEMGSEAIVDILDGTENPSGKLPCTVARCAGQIPIYYAHPSSSSYSAKGSIAFDTYSDGVRTPRYYFGFGLSYTSFEYSNLKLNKREVSAEETVKVFVTVKNTGNRVGTEIVQLYMNDPIATVTRPVMQLEGFARVTLTPGEEKEVCFEVPLTQLTFVDLDMNWKVERGEMNVMIGSSSEDIRLKDQLTITDSKIVNGKNRGFYAKAVVM